MGSKRRQRSDALVGRASEVAELDRELDRVGTGEPWFVQLAGEPGIGKTRLLAELRRPAEQRGWFVLDGRAAEFERDVPFGLMVDALNDYIGGLEPALLRSLDDDALAELASIFPSLSRHAAEEAPRAVDSERYRAQYAIRACSASSPATDQTPTSPDCPFTNRQNARLRRVEGGVPALRRTCLRAPLSRRDQHPPRAGTRPRRARESCSQTKGGLSRLNERRGRPLSGGRGGL